MAKTVVPVDVVAVATSNVFGSMSGSSNKVAWLRLKTTLIAMN